MYVFVLCVLEEIQWSIGVGYPYISKIYILFRAEIHNRIASGPPHFVKNYSFKFITEKSKFGNKEALNKESLFFVKKMFKYL